MIFNVSEMDKIDFSEVLESGAQLLRKSVDETKTFVKWDGSIIPNCVEALTTSEGPYTYSEIISILGTPYWTVPMTEGSGFIINN
jgi:hypothetical protein